MIIVKKAINADSRTADANMTKEDLITDTKSHIQDVTNGLNLIAVMLKMKGPSHDHTKLDYIDDFYNAIKSGHVKETMWYQKHITMERHHILSHVPDDVNLLDILEHIVDCVMAGSARTGNVYDVEIPPETLQLAVANTIDLLKKNIQVVNPDKELLDSSIQ